MPHIAKPNPAQLDQREAAVNKLADLLRLQQILRQHPDVGLLLLDTTGNQKNVLAAIAKGDVDNAERVGVTVGGMTTNVRGSAEGMTSEAINQYNQAVELRLLNRSVLHPDAVASVAWLGYEAPGMNFDVTDDSMAKVGSHLAQPLLQGPGCHHQRRRAPHHRIRPLLRIADHEPGPAAGRARRRRRALRVTGR